MHLGTHAAVKVLYTRLATKDHVEKFEKEARTVAHFKSPHIVRIFDYNVEDSIPFLVMDYAPGGTLRTQHPKGTILPLTTIVSYVEQIANALQYAHDQRIIHRDVKPENMLIGKHNKLLLSDFGIATLAQSSRYQSTQDIAGTMAYMAPEQIQGHPCAGSDQYSLGIIVYEWLSGDRPFRGSMAEIVTQHLTIPPPSLREKIPTISSDLEQVIMTALMKDFKQRFECIQAFATALELAYQTVLSYPTAMLHNSALYQLLPSKDDVTHVLPSHSLQTIDSNGSTDQLSQSLPQTILPSSLADKVERTTPLSSLGGREASFHPHQHLLLRRKYLAYVLAFLVLLASWTGLFSLIRNNQVATENTQTTVAFTPTRTALSAVTTTVNATLTVQAHVATNALQNISNRTPTFQDSLASDTNNWGDSGIPNNSYFSGGVLHILNSGAGGSSYVAVHPQKQNLDFYNFAITVEIKVLKGFGGGIIFRDNGLEQYYYFLIGANAYYSLLLRDTNMTPASQTLLSGYTSAIHKGLNQTNLIGVVANGSIIDLYVNRQNIDNDSDSAYSHGMIGLFAYDSGSTPNQVNPPVEVLFSNLKVWNLQ